MVTCVRSAGASRYSQVRHHLRICLQKVYLHPSARRLRGRRRTVTFSSLLRLPQKFRNIDRIAIAFPLRVPLSPRLTLSRLTSLRNPWAFGVDISMSIVVTYAYIFFSGRSSRAHAPPSTPSAMLPYRSTSVDPIASAAVLMPAHHPRVVARLVSCYALFE